MPSQQAITSAEVLLDSYSLVLFFKSSAFSNLRPYWKIVLRKKTMSPSFIGEKIKYSEKEVPKFGELPFDHFVLEEWDVASTKSEAAQRTDLVKAWLALGSQGRLVRPCIFPWSPSYSGLLTEWRPEISPLTCNCLVN